MTYYPYLGGPGYSWPWYQSFLAQRSLRLVTRASAEHITIDQARSHLRLDTYGSPPTHPDDSMIETVYIPAARAICEAISGRSFASQVFELGVGGFPTPAWTGGYNNGMALAMGPVRGITSVVYSDGTTDVIADPATYTVDLYTDGGYLFPVYSTSWPTAAGVPNAVRVRFAAGYDVEGSSPFDYPLPADYLLAMYLVLGHIYENRENTTPLNLQEIPMGVQAILGPSSMVNNFA